MTMSSTHTYQRHPPVSWKPMHTHAGLAQYHLLTSHMRNVVVPSSLPDPSYATGPSTSTTCMPGQHAGCHMPGEENIESIRPDVHRLVPAL